MDLTQWIDRHAAFTPDRVAIEFESEAIAYRELAARVARAAGALRMLGVGPGDRVAWLGQNHPATLVLLFACARLRAIVVPLNWRLAAPELRRMLKDCEPRALFAQAPFRDTLEQIGIAPGPRGPLAIGAVPPGWGDGNALLDVAAPVAAPANPPDDDAPVLICYTSGSTGAPKGAVLTQAALFWNAVNSTHMHDLTRADRVLTTLPLFHVGGLCIQTLPALHAGATVYLHPKFDAGVTLEAITRHAISLTVLVPAQLDMLVAQPGWAGGDLTALRCITTGSMIVPMRNFAAARARGVPLIQVYGCTETGPIATYTLPADATRKIGSAGKAAVHCSVRVVAAAGRDAGRGESGEILVRGPNVMTGYWNAPAETAAALDGGWFHTGDIGHFDDDGDLWIDGRSKDLIISGGENIYPAEIENVLAEAPDIAEVAVVGRPDPTWGEVVVAAIVTRSGRALAETEVRALLQDRIARYKHPREIVFLRELPRSALGKLRRDELRRMLRGEALVQ
ncbi:MAG TPA: AMP-binding protein [Casimicrobiaceae bacterium]